MARYILVVLTLVLSACGEMQSQVQFHDRGSFGDVEPDPQPVDPNSCEINPAEFVLDTRIVALEMVSQSNLRFGFDMLNGWLQAFGLKFKAKSAQMTVVMDLYNPLRPHLPMANAQGSAQLNKNELNLSLDFGLWKGDIGYFYQTPLSILTKKALVDTVRVAGGQLDDIYSPWFTRVQSVHEDIAVIPVGNLSGLRVGDQFSIFKTHYVWRGRACESELIGEYRNPEVAIAQARVIDLNESYAFVRLTGDTHQVSRGDKLEILSLVQEKNKPKRTSLKRSVQLRAVSSGEIRLEDGAKVNIVPYVQDLLKPALRDANYFLR